MRQTYYSPVCHADAPLLFAVAVRTVRFLHMSLSVRDAHPVVAKLRIYIYDPILT